MYGINELDIFALQSPHKTSLLSELCGKNRGLDLPNAADDASRKLARMVRQRICRFGSEKLSTYHKFSTMRRATCIEIPTI